MQEFVSDGGQDQVAVNPDHPSGLAEFFIVAGRVGVEVLGYVGGIAITGGSALTGSGYGKAVQAGA
jgi:hypothetical protein